MYHDFWAPMRNMISVFHPFYKSVLRYIHADGDFATTNTDLTRNISSFCRFFLESLIYTILTLGSKICSFVARFSIISTVMVCSRLVNIVEVDCQESDEYDLG